jgi:hypothetical protein
LTNSAHPFARNFRTADYGFWLTTVIFEPFPAASNFLGREEAVPGAACRHGCWSGFSQIAEGFEKRQLAAMPVAVA